jgi:hypothetical protein
MTIPTTEEVFAWPEFAALMARLGVDPAPTVSLTLCFEEGAAVKVLHQYRGRDVLAQRAREADCEISGKADDLSGLPVYDAPTGVAANEEAQRRVANRRKGRTMWGAE